MKTHMRRGSFLLVVLMAAALLPTLSSRAETRSLFGRSAAFADMLYSRDPLVTPDNRFILIRADLETNGVYNLYRVPIEGGQPVKLNGAVAAGKGVRQFALSPNGTRLVYTSAQEVENRDELYSVPIEGGQPVKLSGALPSGGNVDEFQISSNNASVIYLADQDANDVFELYSVPLAGGTLKKLNMPLVAGGDVLSDFAISPNTQFVVYRADQEANDRYELYGAPLNGSAVQKLNGTLAAGGSVDYFRMSPILNIATYVAKEGAAYELYSVQLNGNPIGKLNGALPAGQRVTYSDISADGQRVVYQVGPGFSGLSAGLYSVSIFGGASTLLSPPAATGGGVGFTRLSADSKYIVFGFQSKADDPITVYSAALDGSGRVLLYSLAADHTFGNVELSADSGWFVFTDYTTVAPRSSTVYAVPLRGGTPIPLSSGNENAFSPLISPKNDRVLFYGYAPSACDESNLYSVQIFGGARRTLTALCGTRGNIDDVMWSADGSRIIYSVSYDDEQRNDAGFELWISDGQAVLPPPPVRKVYLPMMQK